MDNILLDADAMYPEGFHPVALNTAADYSSRARYTSRTGAGAKYYYVNFGISVYIPEAVSPKFVTGTHGEIETPQNSWVKIRMTLSNSISLSLATFSNKIFIK